MATVLEDEESIVENFSDFEDWYNEFTNRHRGYSPDDIQDWFNDIENSHTDIRNKLGGIRNTTSYELEEFQHPANVETCDVIIDRILRYIPRYIKEYGLTRQHFLWSTTNDGMRTSKHIMTYAGKMYLQSSAEYKNIQESVAELGRQWAKAKVSEQQLYSTITTSARAFATLGHYGPDNKSCFKQSSENAICKYNLGTAKNTFVLLIKSRKTRSHEPEDSDAILARMWGFYNADDNVFNFCNYYPAKGFIEGNAYMVCGYEACRLLPSKEVNGANGLIKVNKDLDIYHNNKEGSPNWSFYDKSLGSIDTQSLND